jgi:hypothetical protein
MSSNLPATHDVASHAVLLRPSPRQVILGLFVLWQLVFLIASNLIGLYHDAQGHITGPDLSAAVDRVMPGYTSKRGHSWEITDEFATALRRWAQLTGQPQSWGLFAPNVYHATGFPAVVLLWDDAPTAGPEFVSLMARLNSDSDKPAPATQSADLLPSENEPPDRYHFLRLGRFRLRRLESPLILYLTQKPEETVSEAQKRWASRIQDHVSENADMIETYLKWRFSAYQERHPERPQPKQLVLVERVYSILPPDDASGNCWSERTVLPLARWQPDAHRTSDQRAIERFNPVTDQFEYVPR